MNTRNFKGIWISKEIWLSKDLTLQEKVFLVEIDSLDNDDGCFATNAYFAEFFGLSKKRVSVVINSLVEKKYITSEIILKERSKQVNKRILRVLPTINTPPLETGIPSPRKHTYPTPEKFTGNNTINNTINKNKRFSYPSFFSDKLKESFKDYIDHREQIKKKITKLSFTRLINKLVKLCGGEDAFNEILALKIIDTAIERNWASFFEIKENTLQTYKKPSYHNQCAPLQEIRY